MAAFAPAVSGRVASADAAGVAQAGSRQCGRSLSQARRPPDICSGGRTAQPSGFGDEGHERRGQAKTEPSMPVWPSPATWPCAAKTLGSAPTARPRRALCHSAGACRRLSHAVAAGREAAALAARASAGAPPQRATSICGAICAQARTASGPSLRARPEQLPGRDRWAGRGPRHPGHDLHSGGFGRRLSARHVSAHAAPLRHAPIAAPSLRRWRYYS